MKQLLVFFLLLFITSICFSQTGPAGVGNTSTNKMWLKADVNVYKDAGTSSAADGDLVQQWNDQSGNGINATQVTTDHQPTFKTNIINGKPALQFSGNTFIDGSSLGIVGTGGYSFVFVFQATSYSSGSMNDGSGDYIMDRTLVTNELTGLKVTSSDKYGAQKRNNDHSGIGGAVSSTAVNTSSFEVINYRRVRGTSYDLFLNGTLDGTTADDNVNLTPPIPRIGRHATEEGNGLNGYITEMMAFNFDLNNAQINIVNSYLSAKYALTIDNNKYNFGSTHGNDVAGIGREDATNEHVDAQSAGILQVNSASSLEDNEYLLFGHDNASISDWSTSEVPNSETNINRLSREWKLTETGDVGTVKFTVDTSLLPARTANYTTLVLMVDSDGDFTDGASVYEMVSPGSNNFYETVATVDISDGDYITIAELVPTIQFSDVISSGFETNNASVSVELNFINQNNITATYNTSDNTASSSDYTPISSGSLTINAGSKSTYIAVNVTNDTDVENDEQFDITLSNPSSGVNLGANTDHNYIIHDDDNLRKIYFSTGSSNNSEATSPITITVSIDNAQIDNVNPTSVDYEVTGGTATDGGTDFTLAAGTATILAGSETTTFAITIIDDALYEENETIIITLSNPTNCNLSSTEPIEYTYTINDNDSSPEIEFATATLSGDEGSSPVDLVVNLSTTSAIDAQVTYTVSGSASGGGSDYSLSDGTLTIPAFSHSINISLLIVDDDLTELSEEVIVTLSNPVDCSLGANNTITYEILDNDEFGYTGPGGVGDSHYNYLWLKADEGVYSDGGSSYAVNNNTVQQWNDFSGNSNHAIQAVEDNQPTFTTGSVNLLPAIQFSGNDFIDPSAFGMSGLSSFSYYIVVNTTSYTTGDLGDGDGDYIIDRTSESNELVSLKVTDSNKFGFQKRTNNGANIGGPSSTTDINTSAFQIVNFTRNNGISYEIYVDATLGETLTDNDDDITPPTLRIGRHAIYTDQGLNGSIAELLVYGTYLNSVQRTIVDNYLAAKYGLTINITADKYIYDGTHSFDVAGIGRESEDDFHSDAQGAGPIRINNPSSMSDGDYLFWGHDGNDFDTDGVTDLPATIVSRLERDWIVSKSGDVGSVSLMVDLSSISTSLNAEDLRLLIDDDGTYNLGANILAAPIDLGGGIYQWNTVSFNDGDHFTIGSVNTVISSDLPIELVSFSATVQNNLSVNLEWETASEINNDYFTIERSIDKRTWEILNEIDGAGNSSSKLSYSSIDKMPLKRISYYRLKQTDFDGQYTYSDMIKVNVLSSSKLMVNVYPNPTENKVKVTGDKEELKKIRILNTIGQEVTSRVTIKPISEENIEVNLSNLTTGLYYIKTLTTTKKVYKK